MVNMIIIDPIARSQRSTVSPRPTDRDSAVVKISDLIVRHTIIVTLPDPDANGPSMYAPAGPDDTVVHRNKPGLIVEIATAYCLSDIDAATAEILEQRARH